MRDRRAGRPGPLHVLHRRPLLRRSRTSPTWRSAASRTSRASTTTPTTSTSGCPRTRSGCPTRCSRRRGRCSRRASTRPRDAFLEEFDRIVPGKTPLAPDVMLLHAMIDLKSCRFDDVRATLDELVKTYVPIAGRRSRRCSRIPSKRVALLPPPAQQAIDRRRRAIRSSSCSKIDPRFYKFYGDIVALDREAGIIPDEVGGVGRADRARAEGGARRAERDRGGAAGATTSRRCARSPPAIPRWRAGSPTWPIRRAGRRGSRTSRAGRFAKDAEATLALAAEARRLRARLVAADAARSPKQGAGRSRQAAARAAAPGAPRPTSTRSSARRRSSRSRSRTCARAASPPICSRTLQLEGLMGDDEEYWPFEGEYWSDEYENYK